MARILVAGGTGTVGAHVLRGLLAPGEQVGVLARSAERGAALPAGVSHVV